MDFLIRRPIAVIMAFLAIFIIGLVSYLKLPVSLLPNIAIPQITIQTTQPNTSAREIENSIISPLRQQLLQVNGLDEITSTVNDGVGLIEMRFKFGTNTDYAYIEVNEKIDAAMNVLPPETKRPKAMKASASDIPVFYLNVSLRGEYSDNMFMQLCDVVENTVRRRIEQLPEVAMADVTGIPSQCLLITPDMNKLKTCRLTVDDIGNALKSNNMTAGSMRVKDGIYEYTVKVATLLRDKSDVENIYLKAGDRYVQLKDVCSVNVAMEQEAGMSLANGKRVVTLAVIKQSEEGVGNMKERVSELVGQFSEMYPDLEFSVSRNQTELLDYTISNLKQNLILGLILIILVAILFMGGLRTSLVICICMMSSMVITFLPFSLFGRSLNVISLSGLILVSGMMIDNALIITENIAQKRQMGRTLRVACGEATHELITPLLSSTLTTVAVFLPLVFLDGMAGAIFSDQAFSITAGLAVSYVVGIMLLPVIFRQIMARKSERNVYVDKDRMSAIRRFYNGGFDWMYSHKPIVIAVALLTLPLCWLIFNVIDKSRMPELDYNELQARIEWNADINLAENRARTEALFRYTSGSVVEYSAYVGSQDYVVNIDDELSLTEASLYWKAASVDSIAPLTQKIFGWLAVHYPEASVTFAPPTTIFERLFNTAEADVVAQLTPRGKELTPAQIRNLESKVKDATRNVRSSTLSFNNIRTIVIDRRKMEVYGVDYAGLQNALEGSFGNTQVTMLHSYSNYMPVCLAGGSVDVSQLIKSGTVTVVKNDVRTEVPIRTLVKETTSEDLKTIVAGKSGAYIPICFYGVTDAEQLCNTVQGIVADDGKCNVDFAGSFFGNRKMVNRLIIVLLISLMLMYFILCAQFESFLQPLIVLVEIPIDMAFGLLVLLVCGHTLNLMSCIGIIVSCGIVINDSILKIDSINELRKQGVALLEAVHLAGQRRLRAIVMTSLTTIGAMVPVLFTSDMGSELQQPLAVAMIATMIVGTFVSLFVIPLVYSMIEKKELYQQNNHD